MADIHHLFRIQATSDQVFAAITSPQGLNAWWTQSAAGQPLLGEEYQFYFGEDFDWRAEVIMVFPPRSICWQMTKADADWLPTRIHFDLEPEGEGTLVRFSHENWLTTNDHFRRTSFCWAMYLHDLRKYLEQNIQRPFTERAFV